MSDINTLINRLNDRLNDRQRREFALWCAERVRHLMTDRRSTNALDVAARYLRGEATYAELDAATVAAHTAWHQAEAWSALGVSNHLALGAAAWAVTDGGAHWSEAGFYANRAAQSAELERMLKEVKP